MFKRTRILISLEPRCVSRLSLLVVFTILVLASQARAVGAVGVNIRIRVQSQVPPRLIIEGEHETGMQIWSFRKTHGALMGLGERITHLVLRDRNGKSVDVRKLGPGEYKASAQATRFRYEVELDPTIRAAEAANVSWLTPDRGLLLPGDLLPSFATEINNAGRSVRLSFELPELWLIASVESRTSRSEFEISEPDRAVFFISKDLRQAEEQIGAMKFTLSSSGEWSFSVAELMTVARRIVESYTKAVGRVPVERTMLIVSPFPGTEGAGRWSAETRGSTVLLLSDRQPGRTAALVQLSNPLTHELFHLWVPNALALEGDYDWFFEGFTIYQAMRTAQQLNLLTFQDFLNAVGRAFDTYSSVAERDKLSLIEASKRRWTASPSLIYQKAMLVATLYDLTLRTQSKGKQSLESVYRELFRRHRAGLPRAQANSALLSVLSSFPGMEGFARPYLETPTAVDLVTHLAPFGLRVEKVGLRTQILPNQSLSREQRDLLRRLGYNSEMRGLNRNN